MQSAVSVEERCLPISAPSVNISPVWTRILTTVKSAEYAGESTLWLTIILNLTRKVFLLCWYHKLISSYNSPCSNNHPLKNKRHRNPFLGKWLTHLAGQLFAEQEAVHSISGWTLRV